MRLSLSWPAPALWPNSRVSWRVRSEYVRAARDEAYVVTRNTLLVPPWNDPGGDILLTVTGHKPAEHGQDRDGFNSAMKAYYDGIASALQVNDRRFKQVVDWGENEPPRGSVTVEL